YMCWFFFSSRRRHTRCYRDWSSDVCSSDLSRCSPGRSAITGSAFRSAWLDADRVDQLIDANMDRESESESREQLAGGCTVKESEIGRASCRERGEIGGWGGCGGGREGGQRV